MNFYNERQKLKEQYEEWLRENPSASDSVFNVISFLDLIGRLKTKEDRWIPCSEKLPECYLVRDVFKRPVSFMSDMVLVTVKSSEMDGVHYYVSTDHMTGRTQDDVSWLMSCGYGGSAVYHQEIIAWMPLPYHYKEE